MDLDSADGWRWIWLIAAAVFALGELAVPGSFFMLSFAVGAIGAAIASFAGAAPGFSWAVFVVVSTGALAVLVPIGRRINRSQPGGPAVGAIRWEGRRAVVVEEIPSGVHNTGMVRIEREEWRAESADRSSIPAGSEVVVLRVDGTRVVVVPADRAGSTAAES